ncbi:hypothetical protein GH714_010414 [Hevea brasiliensis]|uniref:F-box domain-containing protein n=1 Tax=Hevea brasiliensis TaxID=3981 RepID=A0A6A6N3M2_HEVBR|nr:hypothetical protein GH714_010414 [Hevea brasiliensis]
MKFHYDLFIEILCRLPIQTLLRFRCLSKTCCSSIDSPDFINLHLNRSIKTSTNRSLIVDELKTEGSIFVVDLDLSDRCPVELHRPHKSFTDSVEERHVLVESINEEAQNLPQFWSHDEYNRNDKILVGFGYDSINNDYKVIKMIQYNSMYLSSNKNDKIRVTVYSLKGNSSTRIDDLNDYYIYLRGDSGVAVSGSLHWVVWSQEKRPDDLILAFDLGNEKFRELPKPQIMKGYSLRVAELGGSLAISCLRLGTFVEIWVMKEHGITESWTKLFRINYDKQHGISDLYRCDMKPLCFSETGDEVLLDDNYGVYSVLYDLEQKSAKRVTIFGSPERESKIPVKISASICVRSLVPVNFNSENAGSSSELQGKKRKGT